MSHGVGFSRESYFKMSVQLYVILWSFYLCIYMYMHMHQYTIEHVWEPEESLKNSAPSFHNVGLGIKFGYQAWYQTPSPTVPSLGQFSGFLS